MDKFSDFISEQKNEQPYKLVVFNNTQDYVRDVGEKDRAEFDLIIKSIKSKIDHSQKSVSIDTNQDLNYVKKIFKNIKDPSKVSMKKLLRLI